MTRIAEKLGVTKASTNSAITNEKNMVNFS